MAEPDLLEEYINNPNVETAKAFTTSTPLNKEWTIWKYAQNTFLNIAHNGQSTRAPYQSIGTLKTVHDMFKYLKFLNTPTGTPDKSLNLHNVNLILMAPNIQPLWEDESNKDCGCYSIIIPDKGPEALFNIWMHYVIAVLTNDFFIGIENKYINGLQVSFVRSNTKTSGLMIKIWDGKRGRQIDEFKDSVNQKILDILPDNISERYEYYQNKNGYGNSKIVSEATRAVDQGLQAGYSRSEFRGRGRGKKDTSFRGRGRGRY